MARWRARFISCVAAALCAACASTPVRPPVRPPPALATPEVREAARLLDALPPGADTCVVAFPGRLPSRRRRLVARLSQTSGLPFVAPEGPRVYAEVARGRPDGGVSRVILLSFAGDAARLSRFLTTGAPLIARFVAGEADGPHLRARRVAPGLVRLERGAWPGGVRPGAERACRGQLRQPRAVDAIELSAARRSGPPQARASLQWSWLLPATGGVLERRSRPRATDRRELTAPAPGSAAELDALLGPPRERAGGYERRVRFEDLELLAQDDAQRRRLARGARGDRVEAVERVALADVPALLNQVRLREVRYRLQRLRGEERGGEALLELLRRGLAAHPEEPRIVLPFVRLALELGEDPEAALRALATLERAATADPRELGALRREAFAHASAERLARGLADELGLGARESTVAAAQLLDAMAQGTRYEVAEGLWLAQRALTRRGRRALRGAPRGLTWPVASLPETAAALADGGPLERSLYVVVRAPALLGEAGNLPLDLSGFATLHYGAGAEGVWVLGATTRRSDVLVRLGALLASRIERGDLSLTVAVVPFGGDATRPDTVLEAAGAVAAGRFTPRRLAFRGAATVDWARVAPLLGDPLAMAGGRIFPTPELHFDGLDEADASEVRAALDSVADCRWRVGGLTCAPRADRGVIGAALAELCRRERGRAPR